jgi:hypothetical protein
MTMQPSFEMPGGEASMRSSTADRERAIDVLQAAFAEGRLTRDEFDTRTERVYTSQTYRELVSLTGDLPAGPAGTLASGTASTAYPVTPAASRRTSSLAVCAFICALLPGIPSLAAIPMGLAARRRIRATGEGGAGIAAAAITIGSLELLLFLVLVAAHVVHL